MPILIFLMNFKIVMYRSIGLTVLNRGNDGVTRGVLSGNNAELWEFGLHQVCM